MSYVQNSLMPREHVVYQGQLSIWCMVPSIIVGTILLAAYGLGLLVFLLLYIRYISTELAITNRRVISKTGFISRSTVELSLQKIESVQVDQGILGRVFNFGSIVLAGAGTPRAPITGISNPMAFRRAFLDEQESPPPTAPHPARGFSAYSEPDFLDAEPTVMRNRRGSGRREPPQLR
ncbi:MULTISPECIES: PH domain-containing protein [Achromobacter]|uniref:PH domain-containing protein n=1 Tax=Achromobacter TaxID=222 RepID=UPI0009EA52D2